MEAPNPFNQNNYQEPSQESLKFEGGFWNENNSSNAYDDNNDYASIDSPNAYDDDNKPQKSNPISTLFNNMKAKIDSKNTNINNHDTSEQQYNAYSEPYEAVEPNKPSESNSKSSNLLSTNQIAMVYTTNKMHSSYHLHCEYAIKQHADKRAIG